MEVDNYFSRLGSVYYDINIIYCETRRGEGNDTGESKYCYTIAQGFAPQILHLTA